MTQQDQNNSGDAALKSQTIYDQFGRPTETDSFENGSQYIATQVGYEALGRLYWTDNPSRPGDGLNYQTVYMHDGINRVTKITTPDGSVTTIGYSGNQETVTDPAGKVKVYTYDGLGRLTNVADATGTTAYAYDPNGNLTQVVQGGETRTSMRGISPMRWVDSIAPIRRMRARIWPIRRVGTGIATSRIIR